MSYDPRLPEQPIPYRPNRRLSVARTFVIGAIGGLLGALVLRWLSAG